jgi:hypothetical protein
MLPILLFVAQALEAQALDSAAGLKAVNVTMDVATHQGRKAVHLAAASDARNALARLEIPFHNGAVEVEVAGRPGPGAAGDARGFIGLAFRVADDQHYELFYLRPTNGRADDQLRRNHSVQYEAEPDYPWNRLRSETPGVYESYADIETGVWTKMRIVVNGQRAELYVGGASQPCLIVKDLKLGESSGKIALWVGPGTDGYFSNLKVSPR